jgi:hypothetical protein
MVIVIKDWDSSIEEKTNQGFDTTYNGYYLNKFYEKIKMKIVWVTIIE